MCNLRQPLAVQAEQPAGRGRRAEHPASRGDMPAAPVMCRRDCNADAAIGHQRRAGYQIEHGKTGKSPGGSKASGGPSAASVVSQVSMKSI